MNDTGLWSDDIEMTPADEEAWCSAQREETVKYLHGEGVRHGEVGEWPAWCIPPHVSLWAVESLVRPGWIGWWVIVSDLLCDYCTAVQPAHPRKAVDHFSRTWRQAARAHNPGGEQFEDLGLPAHLAPFLEQRADILETWAADERMWRF